MRRSAGYFITVASLLLFAWAVFMQIVTAGIRDGDMLDRRFVFPSRDVPLIVVQYWALAVVFLVQPLVRAAVTLSRAERAVQRNEGALCPTCGYDLRAHRGGERCPECGRVAGTSSE
jgi:hypothetical protein